MQLFNRIFKREGQASHKRICTRVMSAILALVMVLAISPTGIFAFSAAEEMNVTISYSDAGAYGYAFAPQEITVTAGLAESYGYDDLNDGVSLLDAIVAMHEIAYGNELKDYLALSGTSVTKLMGVSGYNKIFIANDELGETAIPDTSISDGDVIELFELQDSQGMDAYTWFEHNSKKVAQVTAETHTAINLSLQGISSFGWGKWGASPTAPIKDANIVTMLYEDQNGYATAYMVDDLEVSTDSDGNFTLTFNKPGTYYLTAIGVDNYGREITLPWLTVTVLGWTGEGTEENPYLLGSQTDLKLLTDRVAGGGSYSKGKYFKLTADIELDGTWEPVGGIYNSMNTSTNTAAFAFQGNFDGGGHTITFAYGSLPLFGAVQATGAAGHSIVIKNLNISGEYIASNGLVHRFISANNASGNTILIENVTIKSGTVIRESGFIGDPAATYSTFSTGLDLDIKTCTVERVVRIGWDCSTNAPTDISSLGYKTGAYSPNLGVGSFVSGMNGTITDSKSSATVYGKDNVGGLVGYKAQSLRPFTIMNCEFDGEIIATGNYVGGIVGNGYVGNGAMNQPPVEIIDCTVTGTIKGADYVGGILGGEEGLIQAWNEKEIKGNKFEGTIISSGDYVGGVIGYLNSLNNRQKIENNTYIENCGADKGIGGAKYIDTTCENPTAITGVIYVNTSLGNPGISGVTRYAPIYHYYRTDDPLGVDADHLASMFTDPVTQDDADISAAKETLESAAYTATQGEVENSAAAKEKVESIIDGLSLNGVTFTVEDGAFTAATAGTSSNGTGTDGRYAFTVALNKGNGTEQTWGGTLIISSMPYTPSVGDITITIVVEKLTVDGQYIVEPVMLTIPAGSTVAQAVDQLLNALNIAYLYEGSLTESGFYLTGIADSNEPDGFLDQFDHGALSGWMYYVNNVFPDVSAGVTVLTDGDVLRWQYTKAGLGSDIMVQGNKDALLKKVAQINADGNQSEYGAAYTDAVSVLKDLDSTQIQIDSALVAQNLVPLKDAAKAELDAYKNPADYRAEQQEELARAIESGKAAIDAATSALDVSAALTAAKNAIKTIKTDEQLTAEGNAASADYTKALEDVLTYIRSQVQRPQVGSVGGEWAVLALLRGDKNDGAWNTLYLDALEQYIKTGAYAIDQTTGKVTLHQAKITDNERVIIALTALGIDATDFRGYNLVSALPDKDNSGNYKLAAQGINGVIFALISLDSGRYLQNAEGDALRQWCIDYLLAHQKTSDGWSLDGSTTGTADPDITAMALQALAPYYQDINSYNYAQVKTAVEKAVQALQDIQEEDGSFGRGSEGKTGESAAQIVVAFTALGYDGTSDGSFLKSVVVNLLTYRDAATGGFRHTAGGSVDQMASEQAAYALVAYDRYVRGEKSLYDMSDTNKVVDSETTESEKKYVTIKDGNGTGIIVTAEEGVLPEGTELWVDLLTSGTAYDKAKSALGNGFEKFQLFDIYLLKNNVEVQPDGTITISIPVPEGYDGTLCKVYRINDDGTVTDMNAVLKDGFLVFQTDHLSLYAVAQTVSGTTGNSTVNSTSTGSSNAKTGDEGDVTVWITMFSLSALSLVTSVVLVKRRKKRNV